MIKVYCTVDKQSVKPLLWWCITRIIFRFSTLTGAAEPSLSAVWQRFRMLLTPPSSWPRTRRLSSLVFNYPWTAPTNTPAHNPRRTKLNICDTFKANFNLSAKPNLWFVYLVTNVRKKIKAVWYTKQLNLHKVHLKFFFTAYQRLHPIRRKQTAQVQRNIYFLLWFTLKI